MLVQNHRQRYTAFSMPWIKVNFNLIDNRRYLVVVCKAYNVDIKSIANKSCHLEFSSKFKAGLNYHIFTI